MSSTSSGSAFSTARDEVVDAVGVDRDAELDLRRDLVALGDRDVTHVVAEPGEPQAVQVGGTESCAAPARDPATNAGVVDVAGDRVTADVDAGLDVAELPVTVRSLVQVHEVHVHGGPGELHLGLRVQVQERLGQCLETEDPHLRRREGVHPRDDPHTAGIGVRGEHHVADRFGIQKDRLPRDCHRQLTGLLESGGDRGGLAGDLLEGLGAVEGLAAGQKPDFRVCGGHARSPSRAAWVSAADDGLESGRLTVGRRRSDSGRTAHRSRRSRARQALRADGRRGRSGRRPRT